MAEERVQRRLAAILAADVVGYSRLMGKDEPGTLSRLKTLRSEVFDTKTKQFGGRIFKTTGDGALAEFASAVDAVQCSVEIQRELAQRNAETPDDQRMTLRIGISLGDVVVDGEDLYGNGVNVAARMEGLAEPGGICVSGNVQEHIANTLDVVMEDLGEQSVKNIDRPVRCYRVHLESRGITHPSAPLPLPDKPSIAVLPFENMSGDLEQDYFSDGITEDIITALSHIRRLFVIARNTTFAYKGQAADVKKIASELGVRYVLEGSVRKSEQRIRITAQLIDGENGDHIWAERYDRELEDIFELQDEITLAVAGAIEPEIVKVEWERASKKSPKFLDALDCYYRGLAHISRRTGDDFSEARKLFDRAISLDPSFGPAYEGIAITCWFANMWGLPNSNIDEGLQAARKAVELDDRDASAHTTLGRMYNLRDDIQAAISAHEKAIQLNPSSAASHYNLARAFTSADRGEEALPHAELAIRLSPHDTNIGAFYSAMCSANLSLKRNEEAALWGRKAIRTPVINWPVFAFLSAALAYLGELEEAKTVLDELEIKRPGLTLEAVRKQLPIKSEQYRSYLFAGLIKAGMPEKLPETDEALPLPDKPSIAVLPFENMSGDPEQEYFADGIAEDIITALSRYHWFFVIARNSSFSYKGSSPDVRAVASDLGVRYVLEGSLRKVGNRVRITAQLIDATSGIHVWAERYDRGLEDIFAVQDEITGAITSAVAPSFVAAEAQRIERKTPENLHAWDYAIHGNWHLWHLDKEHLAEARKMFQAAIELDPNNVLALSGLALVCSWAVVWGWAEDPDALRDLADETARRAVAADEHDAWAQASLSTVHVHRRRLEAAARAARRAIELNPNLAFGEFALASALAWNGDYDGTIEHIDKAERLSPRDPAHGWFTLQRAVVCFVTGRYEEQVQWAQKMTEEAPDHPAGWRFLAAGYGSLGRQAEAREALNGLLRVVPHYTIELARTSATGVREKDLERLLAGLRKAGVPE